MTFPLQLGLPQLVLLFVGLLGLALFVTSLVGLRPPEPAAESAGRPAAARSVAVLRRVRPALRPRRGVSGVVLLLVSVVLLWFTFLTQTYLGLTGEVHAAHVTATPVENVPHTLMVDLTLYDEHGRTQARHTYQVEGDRWVLQANILELKHWVNVLGVHSGYKLTRLYGQYVDGTPPRQRAIFLDGADEDFFRSTQDGRWWTAAFVRSAYGNAVISGPGEYEVYVSQDAIKTRPVEG